MMKLSAMIRGVIVLMIAVAIGGGAAYAGFGIGMTGAVKNKIKKVDDKVTEKIEEEEQQNRTTYSNASFSGPWIGVTVMTPEQGGDTLRMFSVSNGAGVVLDLSTVGQWSTPGVYLVNSDGKYSVTIYSSSTGQPEIITYGQMTSETAGTQYVFQASPGISATILLGSGSIRKVLNLGAAAGSWTGTLTAPGPVVKSVTIMVDSTGTVTSVAGTSLSGTYTGRMYLDGTDFVCRTVNGLTGAWDTMVMHGTVAGATASGKLEIDSPGNDGTFTLTRN